MSDETTLLPCPFCGGEAEQPMARKWTNCFGDESFSASMRCYDCNLKISTKSCGYETEESAIAAIIATWNTRVICGTLTVEQGSEREKQLEELVRDAYWLIVRAVWTHENQDKFASEWTERVSVLGIEVD